MITEQIQNVLDELHKILRSAVGPRDRREYMREIGVSDRDWHFSLTADEIIKNKIPAKVIGCTGRARLFCKFASDAELKCFAVCTAYEPDWTVARNGNEPKYIGGHQVIAVEIDGKLRMFDPGKPKLEFIDTDVVVGNLVDFGFRDMPGWYLITAIMTPDEYNKINTYQKLRNVYASGDMNNHEFIIVPRKK
ncbi:MAG: hypothetical protein J6Y07_01800 [Alphaproteobacteria bacterium]|nr:hypothetical protein [Alphaproteobacteria bacterium]